MTFLKKSISEAEAAAMSIMLAGKRKINGSGDDRSYDNDNGDGNGV